MQAGNPDRGHRCLARYLALLALAALASGFSPVDAATIIVTNTNDSGPGSLRQAVLDSAVGGTIVFDPSLSGATIYLASTLTIDGGLTIDGSALAAKITVSGDSDANGTGNVRVLTTSAVDPITLRNLVISRGFTTSNGGGISNTGGDLAIVNSTIIASTAKNGGGIWINGGAISVTGTRISGNTATETIGGGGGGMMIFSGAATITNSTISGNSATSGGTAGNEGGGIFNLGTLVIVNSTITANTANGWGGGIFNSGLSNSTVNVYNSTIAVNFGDGDASNGGGAGGIFNNGGVVNIRNTILAKNLVGNGTYDDCGGTINSYGRNLIRAVATTISGTCTINTITGSWTQLNSIVLLGPFGDNGGPTQTAALQPGINAIDGGDPDLGCLDSVASPLTADQRGVLRPKGVRCDVGAFEYSPPSDTDGDGMDDALDNCTAAANPVQCDSDGDGYGNRCDGDLNNNGSTNAQDTTLYRQRLGQPSAAPSYDEADLNCNGNVNAQDTTLYRQLLGAPPGPSGLVP